MECKASSKKLPFNKENLLLSMKVAPHLAKSFDIRYQKP
jgi:hypothetical protein